MFQDLNSKKAAGPGNISPCLLKQCAGQLLGVFTDIFSVSLSQCKIHHCFKKSTIIPVPKKSTASCLNNNTIIPSKLFEKIQNVGVPQSMCLWILDFRLNTPKVIKICVNLSSSLICLLVRLRGVFCDQCYSLFLHVIVYLVMKVPKY